MCTTDEEYIIHLEGELAIESMKNKNILITGTSGILGPLWVNWFREQGANVFGFTAPGTSQGKFPEIDITDYEEVGAFLSTIPTPDIVVCNAALDPKPVPAEEIRNEHTDPFRDYDKIFDINHHGHVNIVRKLIPDMKKNGGGVFVFIGSIMGHINPNPLNYAMRRLMDFEMGEFTSKDEWEEMRWTKPSAYGDSKMALRMFRSEINNWYGKDGIRACMLTFGPYGEGLDPDFIAGFRDKVPLGRPISKASAISGMKFCVECEDFAQELIIDGGIVGAGR